MSEDADCVRRERDRLAHDLALQKLLLEAELTDNVKLRRLNAALSNALALACHGAMP